MVKLVIDEMDLKDVVFQFMGRINGGWSGEVKKNALRHHEFRRVGMEKHVW